MAKRRRKYPRRKIQRSPRHLGEHLFKSMIWLLFFFCIFQAARNFLPNWGRENEQANITAPGMDREEFIEEIAGYAKKNYSNSHVLPSVVVAQACLESDFGASQLAREYGNLFGMKAASDSANRVELPTQEFTDGQFEDVKQDFAVYPSWQAAVLAHGRLMLHGTDWNPHLYDGVREAKDYYSATQALAQAGYATDPAYADKLNHLIENYDLTRFDPKE